MQNRFFRLVVSALLVGFPVLAQAEAQLDTVRKSLVRISVSTQEPDYRIPWSPGRSNGSLGTGFVIEGQRILTNAHVVSNVTMMTVEKYGDPKKYVGHVKFIAHDCDLALVELEDASFYKGMKPLQLGGIPAIESSVNAYGYPIGGTRMSVTRGIVSRIDFQPYSHPGIDQHLAVQIDAAINPGNSGGPVLQNGKVVGVAFQGYNGNVAQSVGYMIPTPVIHRFLADVKDGHYDRYVDLSISYMDLQNPAQRRALGLPDNNRGIMVTTVLSGGAADGILKTGDVLLSIDGHDIASDASILIDGEQVEMPEVVERKFKGDKVTLKIWRDRKEMQVTVVLKALDAIAIQSNSYDVNPRYVLFGGLLFQPLDREYIEASRVEDLRIRYYFNQFITDELYKERPEVVVLSGILPDPINSYLTGYRQMIVDTINGKTIKKLDDVSDAFKESPEYYEIRLVGEGRPIVLERAKVEEARSRILSRYRIRSEQNLKAERN